MAVAGTSSIADSTPVGTATYMIGSTVAIPTLSAPSGSYSFPLKPSITATTFNQQNTPAISYCTTTYGNTCSPSTAYAGAADSTFTISSPTSICANASLRGLTASGTVCYNYAAMSASSSSVMPGVMKGVMQ
jgi:hypothetical protein